MGDMCGAISLTGGRRGVRGGRKEGRNGWRNDASLLQTACWLCVGGVVLPWAWLGWALSSVLF